MPEVRSGQLCDAICRKLGMVRRRPGASKFDKRELLHLSAYIDLVKLKQADKVPVGQALAQHHSEGR